MEDRLAIGRITSSHGVRGEMKIQSLSGEDAHIRKIKRVWLRTEVRIIEKKVISVRGALPNLIIALEGISTPEEARKYRGAEVLVDRADALPLNEGEYYFSDLQGCEVLFEGKKMGVVTSVWENSNCDMLEVKCEDGHIAQLPLQDQFVGEVSTDARRIELKVDWILE